MGARRRAVSAVLLLCAVGARTRVLVDAGAAPRSMRLRAGLGLLTLRSGARLRSLTFVRAGSGRRVRVDAPPAARQCGWRSVTDVQGFDRPSAGSTPAR